MKTTRTIVALVVCICADAIFSVTTNAQDFPAESFFDVFYEVTIAPPNPSLDPLGITVLNKPSSTEPPVPCADIFVGFSDSPMVPTNQIFTATQGYIQPGIDFPAESFFDVFYELPEPDPEFPPESFFDVFFDIQLPDGTNAVLLGEPDVFAVDSFFDIDFRFELPNGIQTISLHGEPGPGLSFVVVQLDDYFAVDSFFDVFFEIEVDVPDLVDPAAHVLNMRMEGSIIPEPTTMSLITLGAILIARRRNRLA